MPANTISQNNIFVTAVAAIHSCDRLFTSTVLLAGSPTKELFKDPLATEPLPRVSRDDLANVAVAVLTTSGHDGASYEITGTQALTLNQAADEFSRATGIPASYWPETIEEAKASRAKFNPTDWELDAWVSTYAAIATGELSVVSHSVEALTGHAPQTLADYLYSIQRAMSILQRTDSEYL